MLFLHSFLIKWGSGGVYLLQTTVASLTSKWPIIGASVFSLVLVVGAYMFAKNAFVAPVAQASTETALLQAIATKDTDTDGLPDWEESLYGTDPLKPDTRGLGMSDGEAVKKGLIVPKANSELPTPAESGGTSSTGVAAPAPAPSGTLTAAFSQQFFYLYLAAKQKAGGEDLTAQQVASVAQTALQQLSSAIAPASDFKTANEIKTGAGGADAFRAYAAAAEAVVAAHSAKLPKNELEYLADAEKGDSSGLDNLEKLSVSYRNFAAGWAALSVPPEVKPAHLKIVNAAARISGINHQLASLDTDPLSTMLALQLAPDAVRALAEGFIEIEKIAKNTGVIIPAGMPGASFVNVMSAVRARTVIPTP